MREKVYDGKLLFQTYCGMGTAASVRRLKEFASKEMPNPKTGTVSQMGVIFAMWRWAFQNPEEAYPYWKELQFNIHPDREFTFHDFLKYLQNKGKDVNICSRDNLRRFCAKYNLPMDYRIDRDDIIQVVRKDHPLFQSLFVVDGVEGENVRAFALSAEGKTVQHSFLVKEIGVCGRVII